MCNIEDAITFKNVNNSVIDQIEGFVKDNIPRIIADWIAAGKSINKEDFFGKVYALNPESFKFVFGDRILILELARHVKKIIETHPSGLSYFQHVRESSDK